MRIKLNSPIVLQAAKAIERTVFFLGQKLVSYGFSAEDNYHNLRLYARGGVSLLKILSKT
jgi:hypothetical protein